MAVKIFGLVLALILFGTGMALACSSCGCQSSKGDEGHDHSSQPQEAAEPSAEAPQQDPAASSTPGSAEAVSAGNKVCPVMGNPVPADSPYTVLYEGKIYNLCCAGCEEEFLKDPQAALKNLKEDLVGTSKQ